LLEAANPLRSGARDPLVKRQLVAKEKNDSLCQQAGLIHDAMGAKQGQQANWMLLVKRHFVNVSRNSKNSFGNSNQYPILVRRGQQFSTGLPLPSTALAMKPRSLRGSVRLIRKFTKTRKPMGSLLTMKKNLLSSKNTSKMPLFANIITKFSKTVHSRIMSTLYDGCEHFTSLSIFLQIIAGRTRNADKTRSNTRGVRASFARQEDPRRYSD